MNEKQLREKIIYMDPISLDSKGWKLLYDYCINNLRCDISKNNKIVKLYNEKYNNYKNYGNFKKYEYITKRMYNSKIRTNKIKKELIEYLKMKECYNEWNIL